VQKQKKQRQETKNSEWEIGGANHCPPWKGKKGICWGGKTKDRKATKAKKKAQLPQEKERPTQKLGQKQKEKKGGGKKNWGLDRRSKGIGKLWFCRSGSIKGKPHIGFFVEENPRIISIREGEKKRATNNGKGERREERTE